MAFQIIKKQFRHSDCDELNKALDEIISKYDYHLEGLTEVFMDTVLDHSKQKEKEWDELYASPVDWFKSVLINVEQECLNSIINELKEVLYVETPKQSGHMKGPDAYNWLVENVKPLILSGETNRNNIAEILNVAPQTVTNRMQQVCGTDCNWRTYVKKVEDGKY